MSFKDKVVFITGGSAGIGAETAVMFAKEGAKIAIVGRNEKRLQSVAETCKQNGATTIAIKADVTKDKEAKNALCKTIEQFGKLDILINNAGILRKADLVDDDYIETFDLVMNTNIRTVAVITNFAVPHLIKSRGNIVNISSVSGTKISEHFSAYISSKAALNSFTKCVALELAPHGVRVNAVSPGPTVTDIFETGGVMRSLEDLKGTTVLGNISEPKEIADLILYVASDKAKSITGSNYVIDNGMLLK